MRHDQVQISPMNNSMPLWWVVATGLICAGGAMGQDSVPLRIFHTIPPDAIGRRLQGAMIWSKLVENQSGVAVAFRKTFDLPKVPARADLHLFADARYVPLGQRLLRQPWPGPLPAERSGIQHDPSRFSFVSGQQRRRYISGRESFGRQGDAASSRTNRLVSGTMERRYGRQTPVGNGPIKPGSARSPRRGPI